MKLTPAHIVFLRALKVSGPTFRRGLPAADNEQKRARQDCIRWKLAKYTNDGWTLMSAGRRALAEGGET